jgi:hypothetical protein
MFLALYTSLRIGRPAASVEHALLDDLIRPNQERLRDGDAKRLGGLDVDDQLELRGLLDGQIAGLRPFKILST